MEEGSELFLAFCGAYASLYSIILFSFIFKVLQNQLENYLTVLENVYPSVPLLQFICTGNKVGLRKNQFHPFSSSSVKSLETKSHGKCRL